jgi:hypothetical protein
MASDTKVRPRCDRHPPMSVKFCCDQCRMLMCGLCTRMDNGNNLCLACGGVCRPPSDIELSMNLKRQTRIFINNGEPSLSPAARPKPLTPPPSTRIMAKQTSPGIPQPPSAIIAPLAGSLTAAASVAPEPATETSAAEPVFTPPVLGHVGPYFCKNHELSLATRRCFPCHEEFCEECVKPVNANYHCLSCGQMVTPIPPEEQGLPQPTMGERLNDMLHYPFKGEGLWMVILGSVFLWLLSFAGWRGSALGYGYLYAYLMKMCRASATGRETPPPWPSFGNWADDLASPLWQFFLVRTICLAPALLYIFLTLPAPLDFMLGGADQPSGYEMEEPEAPEEVLPEIALLKDPQADLGEVQERNTRKKIERSAERRAWNAPGPLLYVLMFLGLGYMPMALLGLILYRSYAALSPVFVFKSIAKVPQEVMLAYGLLLIAEIGFFTASRTQLVPFVGGLIGAAVWLYFMMVQMRVLGIMYFYNQKRLGWFTR